MINPENAFGIIMKHRRSAIGKAAEAILTAGILEYFKVIIDVRNAECGADYKSQ
jgi:hypothetical protein